MQAEIQREVERVVGGKGVDVKDIDTGDSADSRITLETAEATYDLPAERLLHLLKQMPGRVGVNALRQCIDEHFPP